MKTGKAISIAGTAVAVALALSACRADEQGRQSTFTPGVYLGKADTQLSEAQTRALRDRARHQSDTGIPRGGGGKKSKPDVRPPVSGGLDLKKLKLRARQQGGN